MEKRLSKHDTPVPPLPLAPNTWLTWVLVSILWLFIHLPYPVMMRIARAGGIIVYHTVKRRRAIAEINLRLCFPEWDESTLQHNVRETLINNTIGFAETLYAWWRNTDKLPCDIKGYELLEDARHSGRGVLLIGSHFTILDLAGGLLARYMNIDVTYKAQRNPLINALMLRGRLRHCGRVVDKNDMRGAMRCLKQGRALWYAPDQDYGTALSVFAPFFGVPTATITTTARLAKVNNSIILMTSYFRKADGSGYQIIIEKMPEDFPVGEPVADATAVNSAIENAVRRAPTQYMWVHRRFKSRPEGESSPYEGL